MRNENLIKTWKIISDGAFAINCVLSSIIYHNVRGSIKMERRVTAQNLKLPCVENEKTTFFNLTL